MLSTGAFLTEYDPDFFAGVPWIPFVEQITDSSKTIAVASFTVHTIVDGDKAHMFEQAAIQKNGCTEETAAKFLALAKQNQSRVQFYQTIQDEDSEETGEDVSRDDH